MYLSLPGAAPLAGNPVHVSHYPVCTFAGSCLQETVRGIEPDEFEIDKMRCEPVSGFLRDDAIPRRLQVQAGYPKPFLRKRITQGDKTGTVLEGAGGKPGQCVAQQVFQHLVGPGSEQIMVQQRRRQSFDKGWNPGEESGNPDQQALERFGECRAEDNTLYLCGRVVEQHQRDKTRKGFRDEHDIVLGQQFPHISGVFGQRKRPAGGIGYHTRQYIGRKGAKQRTEEYPRTIDTGHEHQMYFSPRHPLLSCLYCTLIRTLQKQALQKLPITHYPLLSKIIHFSDCFVYKAMI